jgi:hypothetical protein
LFAQQPIADTLSTAERARRAKAYAEKHGYVSGRGGWIYSSGRQAVAQGWSKFYAQLRSQIERWREEEHKS